MIFNFGSAVLRSKGDTRRPLYILVVAGIVNTVLNLILCFGAEWVLKEWLSLPESPTH